MDLDKTKELIRKLLAKADNTACTIDEAKAFNDKAHELMARYNLDRASVSEADRETIRTHKTLSVLIRPWSTAVLQGLCHIYYCKWFYRQETQRSHLVTIIGEESNVAVCHAIAVMVLRAIQQEARGHGRSFMTGAGSEILKRCLEMRPINRIASAATDSSSTALMVLADDEARGNQQYLEEVLGARVKRARTTGPRVTSAAGYEAGRSYGSTLPLRQNLLGK